MVTKRPTLKDEITRSMEGRAIGAAAVRSETGKVTKETQNSTSEMQKKPKGYKNTIVSIRFDEGDYERLKEIAQEQGTNGAALVRKAVKDIIKAVETV
jgi:hypothetical protein